MQLVSSYKNNVPTCCHQINHNLLKVMTKMHFSPMRNIITNVIFVFTKRFCQLELYLLSSIIPIILDYNSIKGNTTNAVFEHPGTCLIVFSHVFFELSEYSLKNKKLYNANYCTNTIVVF